MTIVVHKFGGTSVGSAERIAAVADLIAGCPGDRVVVASAMAGVTNRLVGLTERVTTGRADEVEPAIVELHDLHMAALYELTGGSDAQGFESAVNATLAEARALLQAAVAIGELPARARDRLLSIGEKLSVRLLAVAFERRRICPVVLDADEFLETDDRFGAAQPDPATGTRPARHRILPLLAQGMVPIVTGFCGRAPDGATTTLGRGGTDLSATYLGAVLEADEVVIWTDVDGVFTANPTDVTEARLVPQLNYREAAELSFYGAKVLHPRTMIPVVNPGIPVYIRNSFHPDAPGTVVDGRFTPGSHPVKAVTAVRDQALVSIEGKGMAGRPGVAAGVFSALAEAGISITMISQSSSESSICFAIPSAASDVGEQVLKRALADAIAGAEVEEIVVRRDVALVAAVGLGMAQTPGVAARLFTALADQGINVLAIAQGSSELNVSLAIEQAGTVFALRAIHREFGLDRLDTGDSAERRLDLLLMGCGQIGRALVRRIAEHPEPFERLSLQPRIVGVVDRTGYVLAPLGLEPEAQTALLAHKEAEGALVDLPEGQPGHPSDLVEAAAQYRLSRPILVDVSDADAAPEAFVSALKAGADVVTANKKPLAADAATFAGIRAIRKERGRVLRAEATVGAGLPIVDTLEMLMATGDEVRAIEGSLSGTLGFLMGAVEAGMSLSDAVQDAMQRGFTEPDPLDDLSGWDVARKALILARWSGVAAPDVVVERQGLVPDDWGGLPVDELLARLRREVDEPLAAKVAAAKERGEVLRYVASVRPDGVRVGPTAVPATSALGQLRGTDNLVQFETDRYADRPLVVVGPGAGVQVTAMGVLSDILRIAAVRS
ncbi:MAG: bifunctional aspartate kinase/homoserine dehydrogenase I [Myxococcota bacterium]